MDASAEVLERIFGAIGSLNSEVTALRRDLQNSVSAAKDDVRRADERRAEIHDRMDEIAKTVDNIELDITQVKHDLAVTKSDVSDSKEVTDKVKKWEMMGVGALAVTGMASAAITALFASYGTELLKFFRAA